MTTENPYKNLIIGKIVATTFEKYVVKTDGGQMFVPKKNKLKPHPTIKDTFLFLKRGVHA